MLGTGGLKLDLVALVCCMTAQDNCVLCSGISAPSAEKCDGGVLDKRLELSPVDCDF